VSSWLRVHLRQPVRIRSALEETARELHVRHGPVLAEARRGKIRPLALRAV